MDYRSKNPIVHWNIRDTLGFTMEIKWNVDEQGRERTRSRSHTHTHRLIELIKICDLSKVQYTFFSCAHLPPATHVKHWWLRSTHCQRERERDHKPTSSDWDSRANEWKESNRIKEDGKKRNEKRTCRDLQKDTHTKKLNSIKRSVCGCVWLYFLFHLNNISSVAMTPNIIETNDFSYWPFCVGYTFATKC